MRCQRSSAARSRSVAVVGRSGWSDVDKRRRFRAGFATKSEARAWLDEAGERGRGDSERGLLGTRADPNRQ